METKRIATIIITAEPHGRAVWLQQGEEITLKDWKLSHKEAIKVARELAISLGATAGLTAMHDEEEGTYGL